MFHCPIFRPDWKYDKIRARWAPERSHGIHMDDSARAGAVSHPRVQRGLGRWLEAQLRSRASRRCQELPDRRRPRPRRRPPSAIPCRGCWQSPPGEADRAPWPRNRPGSATPQKATCDRCSPPTSTPRTPGPNGPSAPTGTRRGDPSQPGPDGVLSDVAAELDAARQAGWHTVGIRRPGEQHYENGVRDHLQVTSITSIRRTGPIRRPPRRCPSAVIIFSSPQ